MKKKEIKEEMECHCNDNCNCEEHCECDENCNCNSECNCGDECHCREEEIGILNEKIKKLEEALLRNQAELQNYKRRKDEEVSRLLKYSEEDIASEFLPILDNFERAINMDDNNLDDEVSKFLEGFKMVYCQVKNLLEKYEIKEIDCDNKEFDPAIHQGVMTGKDETKESGIILEVMQKGYMYKDRLLRPSMVKVNE